MDARDTNAETFARLTTLALRVGYDHETFTGDLDEHLANEPIEGGAKVDVD